jgi:phosphoglycolate phosphatase
MPLVLFDLDGTLVDPAGGITEGIRHGLETTGVPVPGQAVLDGMVGPPLAVGLASVPGVHAGNLPEIIGAYRGWYRREGMSRSRVYPGMRGVLESLGDSGFELAVATQKPQGLAEQLLDLHELSDAFAAVCGSPDQEVPGQEVPGQSGHGRLEEHELQQGKTPIIARALRRLNREPESAVMVGDRRHDVHGAHANGVPCIGISWGFAADGELAAAGAFAVVDTVGELELEIRQRFSLHGREAALHGRV